MSKFKAMLDDALDQLTLAFEEIGATPPDLFQWSNEEQRRNAAMALREEAQRDMTHPVFPSTTQYTFQGRAKFSFERSKK